MSGSWQQAVLSASRRMSLTQVAAQLVPAVRAAGQAGRTVSLTVSAGLCRAGDLGVLVVAEATAYLMLRPSGELGPVGQYVVVAAIGIIVALFLLDRGRHYNSSSLLDPFGRVVGLAGTVAVAATASCITLSLLHAGPAELGQLVTQPIGFSVAAAAGLLAFRGVVAWRLRGLARDGRLATKVAVVGANAFSLKFLRDVAHDPAIDVVGVFDDRATRLPILTAGNVVRGPVEELVAYARTSPVDAIVIALPLSAGDRIAELRTRLAGVSADILLTTDIAGLSFAGGQFTTLGKSPVVVVGSRPLKDWSAFTKAAIDKVGGAALLLLLMPLFAVISVLIRLDSPGPVLFRQTREGFNGSSFTMFKFRTMVHRRPQDEWIQASRGDKRVTAVGRWLRCYSLDELPQLLNVLRGDMSLVGPRPHLATTRVGDRLLRDIVPGYDARHRMKPGMTGWAQVHGLRGETRTAQQVSDRIAHDLYYIDNWSLSLDMRILFGTLLREVFSRSGNAY